MIISVIYDAEMFFSVKRRALGPPNVKGYSSMKCFEKCIKTLAPNCPCRCITSISYSLRTVTHFLVFNLLEIHSTT